MDYMKRKLTLKEALDYLEEIASDDESNTVPQALYIEPPANENGFISGEDDDVEDGEGTPDNVCAAQLKSNCEIVFNSGERISSDFADDNTHCEDIEIFEGIPNLSGPNDAVFSGTDSLTEKDLPSTSTSKKRFIASGLPPPKRSKNANDVVWINATSNAAQPIFPQTNYRDCANINPHEQFEKFCDNDLLELIIRESTKYAIFLGKPNPNITLAEIKVFIGILIISGYSLQSNSESYWSSESDLRNEMIYNSMRKNRFKEISRFLHFEDSNKNGGSDKMWKLRSITDHLKSNMIKHFHSERNLSFDESMIAYFGRHGCKQFIKGKPLRFGYKVWSLCTPSGYLVNFEIYQGKNPRANTAYEESFGKCIAPLFNMIDDFDSDVRLLPFSFYFDNLFTGIPALAYLKSRGYDATGTIRENRIPKNCPLLKKADLKSKDRGFMTSKSIKGSDIHLTKWVDNAVVCLASTSFGINPVSQVQRYSAAAKKKILVPRPCVVDFYNKNMCGVDKMDQNISLYRIGIKGKKWWSCIFTWLIDASIHNAWQLHRTQQAISHKQFRRELATYYCVHYGSAPKSTGNIKRNQTSSDALRFDNVGHYVRPINNRRRCAGINCSSFGRTICGKCDKGLCVKCFEGYHTTN